jgi:Uma2 family endonuclease
LFNQATWADYQQALEDAEAEGRHVYITYDRGRMEIMTVSFRHEESKELLAQIVRILADETGVPIRGAGNVTVQNEAIDRGFEADSCFYTKNAKRVAGKRRLDFSVDPVPDLAIEVEITRRLLDRQPIYEEFGVPELWRYDGERLRFFTLVRGKHKEQSTSPTFPGVTSSQIEKWVRQGRTSVDESKWARGIHMWVRKKMQ